MKRFAGKTVLLTGATGGIGQAVARRFHAEGAALMLVDLDVSQLRAQAQALGEGVSIFAADVTDAKAVDDILQRALASHGRIDVGILNAGIEGTIARLEDQRLADFERVMAVNVKGVFLWLAGLMRHMRRQGGGTLAVTSSTAGLQGASQLGPYVASKHAVLGLVRTAALEGASAGIRVNAIHPGPVTTRMMEAIDQARGAPGGVSGQKGLGIPLQRYGTPDEVAAMVAFACSDEAGFSTGSSFHMDGGVLAGRS